METNASSGYHASPSDSLPLTLPSPTLITDRSEAKSEAPQSAWPFPRDFAPDRSEAKSEAAGAAWLDLGVIIL